MHPPDREHVRGVSAADVDDVLAREQSRHVRARAPEEVEMRGLGPASERVVELRRVLRRIAAGRRHEADLRPRLAREAEHVRVQRRAVRLDAEAAAAHRDDLPAHRRGGHLRVGWWPIESAYFSASSGGRYCASHSRTRSKPAKVWTSPSGWRLNRSAKRSSASGPSSRRATARSYTASIVARKVAPGTMVTAMPSSCIWAGANRGDTPVWL